MSDPTPDNGANGAFVMPKTPQDAILRLIITVIGEGDGRKLFGVLSPGDKMLDHQDVEGIFRDANIVPVEGTYVLETGGSLIVKVTSTPEGVDASCRRSVVSILQDRLLGLHLHLVQALQAFPTNEVIELAARQIVGDISLGSLKRDYLFASKPFVDARNVPVEGVTCATCNFNSSSGFAQFLTSLLVDDLVIDSVGGIKFAIWNHNGFPMVHVGYSSCENAFAAFFNGVLADRVREAIQAVATSAMIEILAKLTMLSRQYDRACEAIQTTYHQIDPEVVTQRVEAMEAEARAELTPEPDDGNDDAADDDDDADDDEEAPDLESAAPLSTSDDFADRVNPS